MSYEEYEAECQVIREENEKYLSMFEDDLMTAGLSSKTIRKHLENVGFYLNEYLPREEPHHMPDGTYMLDMFLGYFFIRKCLWSTPASIKTTAASIRKFYKSMRDRELIEKEDYAYLCEEIKSNMEDWQRDCAQYNDADAPSPFGLGWF